MIRMTILLPVEDTIKHVKAVAELSQFGTGYSFAREVVEWEISSSIENERVWLKEQNAKGKRKSIYERTYVGNIAILPARNNSVIVFTPENEAAAEQFDKFIALVRSHFQALAFLLDIHAEPWKKSPPDKQERDRTIWEHRNLGYTWEQVAEIAKCGVSTAKERYRDMTISVAADSG